MSRNLQLPLTLSVMCLPLYFLNLLTMDNEDKINLAYLLLALPQSLSLSLYYLKNSTKEFSIFMGLPLIIASWHISIATEANFQFYILPIVIFLISASIFLKFISKPYHKTLFYAGFAVQFSTLLIQSLYEDQPLDTVFALLLIAATILTTIFALYTKDKVIQYIAIAFLIAELLIQLYFITITISGWIFIGIIGLLLIALSAYILIKYTNKGDEEQKESE